MIFAGGPAEGCCAASEWYYPGAAWSIVIVIVGLNVGLWLWDKVKRR